MTRQAEQPVPTRRRNRLSRRRDFRLLWTAETVSKTGSAVTTVALPLVAVTTLSASAFQVGLLEAAAWLPWLLISLPAGAWVDQWPRRPVLQASNLVSLAAFASIPTAAWLDALTMTHLLVVAFAAGICKVFFRTACQAYLPTVVDADDLQEGNAKLQGAYSAAEVAGPGLGGLLAQAVGAVNALLVDAGSFLASAVCLWLIRAVEAPAAHRRDNRTLARRIGEGLRYVSSDTHLRAVTLFASASNLILVAVQVLLVIFLIRDVGVSPATVGVLMASMGAGGLAGALITSGVTAAYGTARGLLWCELLAVPFGLLIPLTSPGAGLALFAVGELVLSAGIVAGSVIASTFRQAYCPPNMLGRVTAVTACAVYGSMPIGAIIGGALGTALGVRHALWTLTAALFAPLLFLLASPIRRERDLPVREKGD